MNKRLLGSLISSLLPVCGASGLPAGSYAGYLRSSSNNKGVRACQESSASLFDSHPFGAPKQLFPRSLASTLHAPSSDTEGTTLALSEGQPVRELVIVDSAVASKHLFYQHNRPGVAVVEIAADRDGLIQLSQALAGYRRLEALHIVSHAQDGTLQLGKGLITEGELRKQPGFLAGLDAAMVDGGDVFLYGCELAKSAYGEDLLELISSEARVDVAASSDLSGNPAAGGDWDLEVRIGKIANDRSFSAQALRDFEDVLAINDATGKTITTSGFPGGYSNTKSYDVDATGYVLRVSTSSVSSSALYAGFGYVAVNFGGFLSDTEQLYVEFVSGASFDIDSLQAYSPAGNNTYVFTPSSGAPVNGSGFNLGFATQALNFTNITKLTITRQDGLDLLGFDIDNLVIKNASASDSTPPVFQNSTPAVSGTTISQTTLTVRLDETGVAYYVVVPDGAGAPTASQVKNGQNSASAPAFRSGNINVTSAGADFNANITGLAPGTAYDLYVVAEDGIPNLQLSPTKVDFSTNPQDSDGDLTAAAGVTEPVSLSFSIDTMGEALNLFDFTLSDGGSSDGLALAVSQIVLNVSGTSSDAERSKITWRLNGPDASNVTGTYNAGTDTVTFTALSISVADAASEVYTVNGFFNDATGLSHGNTVILSVDGDTDLSVSGSGTLMGATTPINNGTGTVITDDIPPTVVSVVPPPDLTYVAGGNIDFTVNYSEIVVVDPGSGTAPGIDLTIGATARAAAFASGSGTTALLFRHTVLAGEEDLDGIALAALTVAPNSGSVQDPAGNTANSSFSAIDLSAVLVDALAPQVAVGNPSSDPASGGPVTYTVTYTGADFVTLMNGDVTLNTTGTANGSVAVSGSGTSTRTVTLSSITGDGTLGISLAADTAADNAANSAAASGASATFTVDNTAPAVSLGAPSAGLTGAGPITYTVTYTDADSVTLMNGDVTLNTTGTANGSVAVSGSGTSTRTVTISSITGDGTLGISLAADTASDSLGNSAQSEGPSATFSVDNTAPSVSIGSPSSSATSTGPVTYAVTYTDADSVTLSDPNVSLQSTGTATGVATVTGSGNAARTVTISGISGDGTLGISIASGSADDTAGNLAVAAGPSTTFTVDGSSPSVTDIQRSSPLSALTNADTVDFSVAFSEPVQNLDVVDFSVSGAGAAGAAVTGVGGSGSTYTVTVDVDDNGEGEVNLDLDGANDIQDLVGTGLGSLLPSGADEPYTLDNTAPTLSLGAPSVSLTNVGPVTFSIVYGGADSVSLSQPDVTLNSTGTATGSVSVSGAGTASRTVSVGSTGGDGTLSVSVAMGTAADSAGNSAAAAGPSAVVTIDNTAPVVTVDPLTTSDRSPPLSGTIDDPDATLSLSVDGQLLVPTNNGNGTWSVADNTLTALALGNFDVAMTASDPAGNQATDGTGGELNINPLSVNLSIIKSDGQDVAGSDDVLIYTIIVLNDGPDDVSGAMVEDLVPAALTDSSWTCLPLGAAACTGSGQGDIEEQVDIPAGDGVVFVLSALVAPGLAGGSIINTATVMAPLGSLDPDSSDNSSSDTTLTDVLFLSGFESSMVVNAQSGRKLQVQRDRLIANAHQDGTPVLLIRMNSSVPNLGHSIEVFTRRVGSVMEIRVDRLVRGQWLQGEWIPVLAPTVEFR